MSVIPFVAPHVDSHTSLSAVLEQGRKVAAMVWALFIVVLVAVSAVVIGATVIYTMFGPVA